MADFGPNPDASLYPQPPVAQPNLLNSNPLGLLQLGSQMAVGRAYQNALSPDGSFNQGAFASGIASSPIAALDAPAAAGLRASGIAANTNQFGLLASQNGLLQNYIGSIDPNASSDEARSTILAAATRAGVPPPMIAGALAGMPQGGQAFQNWLSDLKNMALGPNANRTAVPGTALGPSANPAVTYSVPQSTIVRAGNAPVPGGYAPGYLEATAADPQAFVADEQTATAKLANVRNLTTAIPLLTALGPQGAGPTSSLGAQARSFLQTNGIISQNDTDPNVIRDKAQKYLERFIMSSPVAGRSDMAQGLAAMSSPNLDTAMAATLSLAKKAVAFERMDAAMPSAFQSAFPGAQNHQGYVNFKSTYYQNKDPTAFEWDQMAPSERKTYLGSLGVTFDKNGNPQVPAKPSAAYQRFVESYRIAKQTGQITPEGGPGNGQ